MNRLFQTLSAGRHACLAGALAALLVCAACSSKPTVPSAATSLPAPDFLHVVQRTDHLDALAREPVIVAHPDGSLFVAGYPSQISGTDWTQPPRLWRSDDEGQSWARLDVGAGTSAAQGNSDVDLAVAPDGTLYFAAMGFNRETSEGTHITIGVSTDKGEHWRWQFLSQSRFDDRPWVKVAPDGAVHVIWNDGGGVWHRRSDDRGVNWSLARRVTTAGGSSHLAVGEDGLVAIRVSAISASANRFDAQADAIAVSRDGGASWALRDLPARVEWDPTFADPNAVPRWVEPLAWSDGRLYHLWSEGSTLMLGVSDDTGFTWEKTVLSEEGGVAFFPLLVSQGSQLAATWFVKAASSQEATQEAAGSLFARAARLKLIELDRPPVVILSDPLKLQSWNEVGDANTERVPSTAGEYITPVFLPDGDVGVVAPIQDDVNRRWGFRFWRLSASQAGMESVARR